MASKSTPCTFNNIQYASLAEAASALGYSKTMISRYVKAGKTEVKPREKPTTKRQKIKVIVDGVEYKSMREAEIKVFGKWTGRLQHLMQSRNTNIFDSRTIRYGNEIKDTAGNVYRSYAEMERALGLSQGTISKRVHNNTYNAPNSLKYAGNATGKTHVSYYYDGIIYENLRSAKRWLHHGRAWILKNCIEIPDWAYKDKKTPEKILWQNAVRELLYMPNLWDENRIIKECDRRMKKLFAHGKLIKY